MGPATSSLHKWRFSFGVEQMMIIIIYLSQVLTEHFFIRHRIQLLIWRENGKDLTQIYEKSPYNHRKLQKANWQHKNATKNSITQ